MSDYFWCDFVGNIGVFFILVSLIYDFNLSASIIELVWILISLFGVYKLYNHRPVVASGAATADGDSQ